MKSKVIVFLASSMLATSGFAAERNRAPKEESIGVGSGAAIGAAAGGPVGLIIGAAFGAWLGNRFHDERSARVGADRRSEEATAKARSLQQLLVASEQAVAEKDAALYNERLAHRRDLQEALSVEVFFRTEESGLGSAAEQRLARLAALIEPMDGAVIRLEGHTDARGTETFNANLSTERAAAVREALIRGGMPAHRVIVTAAGETSSTATDVDGMALERRVEMNVVDVGAANRVAEAGSN